MPLSQTYRLRARKRTNTSSLVDGVDIIQQTRKEAKEIDCTLRISVNKSQTNLQIMQRLDEKTAEVVELSKFLRMLYDSDKVFRVDNDMLYNTHGMEYVTMTKYDFTPKPGSYTFTFEFTLTEVKFGDNILTFARYAYLLAVLYKVLSAILFTRHISAANKPLCNHFSLKVGRIIHFISIYGFITI